MRQSYVELVANAPPREEAPEAAQFQAGDRVAHVKFGAGVVISAAANGGDVEYQVAFDGGEVKRLLQTYAKLVPA